MRMKRDERRKQLMAVALDLFAQREYDGVAVEEVAGTAGVSKPVVYEHFGGKGGLYQAVVEHEMAHLSGLLRAGFKDPATRPHQLLHTIVEATFDYIDSNAAGFRLLSHQSLHAVEGGTFSTVITDVAEELSDLLRQRFDESTALDPHSAPIYAQLLAGALVQVGTWWADHREVPRGVMVDHVMNFLWAGLRGLQPLGVTTEG